MNNIGKMNDEGTEASRLSVQRVGQSDQWEQTLAGARLCGQGAAPRDAERPGVFVFGALSVKFVEIFLKKGIQRYRQS